MFDFEKVQEKFNRLLSIRIKDITVIDSENVSFQLNFDNDIKLLVNCFLRLTLKNKIILTSCDKRVSDLKDQQTDILLSDTLIKANTLIRDRAVSDVFIGKDGNITIRLENEAKFFIVPDCQFNEYEFYILSDENNKNVVAKFVTGKLDCEVNEI